MLVCAHLVTVVAATDSRLWSSASAGNALGWIGYACFAIAAAIRFLPGDRRSVTRRRHSDRWIVAGIVMCIACVVVAP